MLLFLLSRRLRRRAGDVPSFGQFVARFELLFLVVIVMGVIYGKAEHAGWFDSLWLVWQTITTVGYGDIPPKTMLGRTGVMVCGVAAISLLSYVISSALDYREDNRRRRRTGLESNKDKSSYVLVCCREEEELLTFISELKALESKASICIVDDLMQELPPKVANLPDVIFIRGPILAKETYQRANIASSRRVIIFPHQSEHAASDATTQTLVSLIERMVPNTVPMMHFLVDPTNEDLFEGLRSKAVYADFAIYTAIQECRDEGSLEIFTHLMSDTHEASPKTFQPNRVVGWTWGQFVEATIRASRKLKAPVNPLALIQNGKSNPCPEFDLPIRQGDSLSLIVHKGFDYGRFEEELAQSSTAGKQA